MYLFTLLLVWKPLYVFLHISMAHRVLITRVHDSYSRRSAKMEKYRGPAEKKLKGVHPDEIMREALEYAEFSSREREHFFDKVYGDILVDCFLNFLQTEPHESKKREKIYDTVLAMGDVKARMIQYETLAKNVPHMTEDNVMANRDINYEQLLDNVEVMINTAEYDAMRSPGKTKMNAATIVDLYKWRDELKKKVAKKPLPKKEG